MHHFGHDSEQDLFGYESGIYLRRRATPPVEDEIPAATSCTCFGCSSGILSLAIGSCGIATTEFVVAGLLPDIADTFGVSIPTAALASSIYAASVAVSAPLITLALSRRSRKWVLSGLMIPFILGNALSAASPNFETLIIGRILSATCHGAFNGIGSVVATELAPPGKGAGAISLMFHGYTVAILFGLPLGTFLGQHFGWRFIFGGVSAFGGVAMLTLVASIPSSRPAVAVELWEELAVFKRPLVWSALATTAFGFGGLITPFTYISPIMTEVAGFSASKVSWLIAIHGLGWVVGNILGGWGANRALMPTLYTFLTALAATLGIFVVSAHYPIPAAITLFPLGFFGYGLAAPLQQYVIKKAEGAPTLASSANISAFNIGIALSVYLGGEVIDAGMGYATASAVGAGLTTLALGLTVVSTLPSGVIRCCAKDHKDQQEAKRLEEHDEDIFFTEENRLPRKNLCTRMTRFFYSIFFSEPSRQLINTSVEEIPPRYTAIHFQGSA